MIFAKMFHFETKFAAKFALCFKMKHFLTDKAVIFILLAPRARQAGPKNVSCFDFRELCKCTRMLPATVAEIGEIRESRDKKLM